MAVAGMLATVFIIVAATAKILLETTRSVATCVSRAVRVSRVEMMVAVEAAARVRGERLATLPVNVKRACRRAAVSSVARTVAAAAAVAVKTTKNAKAVSVSCP